MIKTDVRTLHLEGAGASAHNLAEALEQLGRQARKKGVVRVDAALFLEEHRIPLELSDRGRSLALDLPRGRRRYAATVDGLQKAIADWIREEHQSDPGLLDLFEKLLHLG